MTSANCHIISSSSDSEPENAPKMKRSFTGTTTSLSKKTFHDLSSSDDDEFLPLIERIKRTKELNVDENIKKQTNNCTKEVKGRTNCVSSAPIAISSDDDDDVTVVEVVRDAITERRLQSPPLCMNTSLPDLNFEDDHLFDFTLNEEIIEKQKKEEEAQCRRIPTKPVEKSVALLQREAKKQRDDAKTREKTLKLLAAEQRKGQKPGECLKFIKTILDVQLLEMTDVAVDIPRVLQENGINYVVCEQIVPKCITWKRKVVEKRICDALRVEETVTEVDEDEIIFILSCRELVEAVHHFKQGQSGTNTGRTLRDLVKNYKTLIPEKKITILVIGMHKYFREQSRKEQQTYRAKVRGVTSKSRKKNNCEDSYCSVTEGDVEEAMVELQIQESCNLRFVENSIEVAQTIASFSKAVAEAPYKRDRENDLMFSWLAGFDVRKSVKVDKDGKGLLLLWQRQIQQFNNVSADMAQAIVAEYPSPLALLNAYDQCDNEQECETLLKEIVVRRGAGPLATTRKIGRELSRKIYMFMTAEDGNLILE